MRTIEVFTSGGGAPGANATIRAVVRTAINKGSKVKGITHGYAGLLEGEIADMESTSALDITNRGGTTLYTVRCKESTTAEGQQKGTDICCKHGIDGMVIIRGDGSFRGVGKLSPLGTNTIGFPGTINLDIVCTDYTVGFGTIVNTTMEAIDKIRDTSTSHRRCSIMEVMRRNIGYITLWCGIRNGAEDILLPECYDDNKRALTNRIIDSRRRSKRYNTTINAGGIGHSGSMAKRVEATTGIETRAAILGHMQRGGVLTCKDRVYASIMEIKAVELLVIGESNRLVAYKHSKFVDFGIRKALSMTRDTPEEQYEIAKTLIRQPDTWEHKRRQSGKPAARYRQWTPVERWDEGYNSALRSQFL